MHLDPKRILSKLRLYCRSVTGFPSSIMVISLSVASSLKRPGFLLRTVVLEPVAQGEIGISPNTSGFAFNYRSVSAVCSFGCRPLDGHWFVRGLSST